MTPEPRIEKTGERLFVGLKTQMSLVENKTQKLWATFRPRVKEIKNRLGNELYNLQVYPDDYHQFFSPAKEYQAYALVEVSDQHKIPDQMIVFTLPAGQYAVFLHRGGPATAAETFQYIFTEWLPGSNYELAQRPHFEVLGEKYNNTNPESEEEIWLPVR